MIILHLFFIFRVVQESPKVLLTLMGKTEEIVLKTPTATIGYWNNAISNEDLFRNAVLTQIQ